jgi:hypothetical protein
VQGPRLPLARFKETFFVDLSKVANHGLADEVEHDGKGGWDDQGPSADMHDIQTGKRSLGGVPFNILPGPNNAVILNFPKEGEPQSVTIPVGKKIDTLFLLHSVCGYPGGAEYFRYVLHYADGKDVMIAMGPTNFAGWIAAPVARFPAEEGTFTTAAQTVKVPKYGQGTIYRTEWSSPRDRRGVDVKSIEFINNGKSVPVLIGITGVVEW